MRLEAVLQEMNELALSLLKEEGQLALTELHALTETHLHPGANPGGARARNTTDMLFVKSGKLVRGLIPNQPGNISVATVQNGAVLIEYGEDLSVIPYFRIHNLGGQTGRNLAVTIIPRPNLTLAEEEFAKTSLPKATESIIAKLIARWNSAQ